VAFEYRLWATTPEWAGENDEPDFPDLVVPWPVVEAMADAVPPPPYLGSVAKEFDSPLTRIFLGFDNALLGPGEAERTGAWLADWASRTLAPADVLRHARLAADWLRRAAAAGWYVDWSD
jgi:hypothetical protein